MRLCPVDAHATWPLRQAVLRPHQRVDDMALPGDDAPGAGHFGAFDGGALVGVATVAPGPHPRDRRDGDWRVRGMATAPDVRGRGAGGLLLQACLRHVRAHGGRRVWCNARAGVVGFYRRAGFAAEGEPFDLPDIGPHRLMALELDAIAAVVLDLDGVIVDTEEVWDRERRAYAAAHGGRWNDEATRAMQGMSSVEWAAYLRDVVGVDRDPARIAREVGAQVVAHVREELPLLPGAVAAVAALAARWPLAVASSANREVIDAVLDGAGIAGRFAATVSSEEVARGKPAADVYVEAAARLGADPRACAAVEDSSNGLRAAHVAGMHVIATPNRAFPPAADTLALAEATVGGIADVTPELVASLARP
ncbi:MAG TPA: HAD-IA family hydrolase [Baekduia sp.]|nr:HAD-IA family hydrolase [Baekduia sp.]